MPLSDEAARRFLAYIDEADRSNLDSRRDEALFAFTAWALVHEPDALGERYAFENAMRERGFTEAKSAYVLTVIVTAPKIVAAYEHERA